MQISRYLVTVKYFYTLHCKRLVYFDKSKVVFLSAQTKLLFLVLLGTPFCLVVSRLTLAGARTPSAHVSMSSNQKKEEQIQDLLYSLYPGQSTAISAASNQDWTFMNRRCHRVNTKKIFFFSVRQ